MRRRSWWLLSAATVAAGLSLWAADGHAAVRWYWSTPYAESVLEGRYVSAHCRGVGEGIRTEEGRMWDRLRCRLERRDGARVRRDVWVRGASSYRVTRPVNPDPAGGEA